MSVNYVLARNGSKTCCYNDIALHSRYNPEHEAEIFVQNSSCTFLPKAVIVFEPCISYCAKFLRQKFHNAILCAVRFTEKVDFSEYDKLWDKVFFLEKSDKSGNDASSKKNDADENKNIFSEKLSSDIYNYLGEEILCSTFSLSWQPSAKIFIEETETAWNALKLATEKARAVMFTRGYFSSRWICNAVKNCVNMKKNYTIAKGNIPVVVAASGPSLSGAVKILKEKRNSFFLMAVSSAVSVLIENKIIPDLCVTTDGGYWAKRHLDFISEKCMELGEKTLWAFPPEACVPQKICETENILPLSYARGMAKELLTLCGIKYTDAEENGTVSGTALMLALSITDGDIYFCGLDLAPSVSMQHAQPNALEKINSVADTKIKPKETRIMASRFSSSASLEIYRSWFYNLDEKIIHRVFRVFSEKPFASQLGKIKDISADSMKDFLSKNYDEAIYGNCRQANKFKNPENAVQSKKLQKPKMTEQQNEINKNEKVKIIENFINTYGKTEKWKKEFFPLETLSIERTLDETEKNKMIVLLEERNKKLCDKLLKISNACSETV